MANIPAKITTHVADAKARLIQRFRDQAKISGTVGALVSPIQDIENVVNDLFTKTDIDNGFGVWLDYIGELVGRERKGWPDATYKLQLWGQIGINCGQGTGPDVLSIFTFLSGASHVIQTPYYPAALFFQCDKILSHSAAMIILQIMQQVVAAGVKVIGIGHYDGTTGDTEDLFAFEGPNEGKGFGDVNFPDEGGKLTEIIAW